ncbi:hypothetical protein AM493_15165 [Flavobacterium akiainvivens]|uniref:SMODS and SLOG-associating 2TM effector domain-containing protein n=1 Tax=Flavobacterium akiainvivens TaxID=1202724 RepID=A0A0M9VJ05_9FLAO|nr:hypothetical protein [Flavobacterium akiainvivens]KOS07226.1 hypothetical protein AM493_15165 [Flavobacterium akiainvivens]SFQ45289.1 hypothetical protein SAMN05444144_10515 [Flavobacterium akiainvivens]
MRARLWYELAQAKYSETYTCTLIGYQRGVLNIFNLIITVFSTAGIMGWKIWSDLPALACGIIAFISLAKLAQPHLIPSDKQIEKLNKVSDFYYDFYLKLEKIWFDYENDRIDDTELLQKFQELKQTEREINRIVNEIHKSTNKKLARKAQTECDNFFQRAFNI